MPFTHLMNVKGKRPYIQGFLDDPTYVFKIAAEEDPDLSENLKSTLVIIVTEIFGCYFS